MPLRDLLYIGRALEQIVPVRDRYRKKAVRLPTPEFYTFYNGKEPWARVCLKIHFDNLHAPLCGIFGSNSVNVARYASLIGTKSPTKCDAQLAESNFQHTLGRRPCTCRIHMPGRRKLPCWNCA